MSEILKSDSFRNEMNLTNSESARVLSAFFLCYALFQVPAGWLSDRFGARWVMAGYILCWSLMTGLMGFATSLASLVIFRMGMGFAQAGAYPTMSATVRRWISLDRRGQASSFISLGGRLGGTLSAVLTVLLINYLGGWRQTLWLYGALGIGIAIAYWCIIRDSPAVHPLCNDLERKHIGHRPEEQKPKIRDIWLMLASCCMSRSLWLNSLGQFAINFGWAFLILCLTNYLSDVKGMPNAQAAFMVTIVLAMGMVGQPIGGWATDWSVRKFGLRVGRVLPISVASFIAACSYLSCLAIDSVWGIVFCCAMVSLMTDIGSPSNWAFMQDVGGKNTASIFGWANMWGNFGAASSPIAIAYLLEYGALHDLGYAPVFLACAAAFLVSSMAALGMNATKPLFK